METRLGIFHSRSAAQQALEDLVARDIPRESLFLLSGQPLDNGEMPSPELSETQSKTPSEQRAEDLSGGGKEPSGAGKASGEAMGAAIGGTAGFTAGATVASLMVPGLGMIFAIGLGAAALLGLGGAAAGAGLGNEIEKNVDMGIPQQEVEFYRELLRQGKSLVVAKVRSGADITTAQQVFKNRGSEDVDKARQHGIKAA